MSLTMRNNPKAGRDHGPSPKNDDIREDYYKEHRSNEMASNSSPSFVHYVTLSVVRLLLAASVFGNSLQDGPPFHAMWTGV